METTVEYITPILKLNLQERIYIYQILWESILKDMQMQGIALSNEQKQEIDRRLERIENGEAKLFSWKEVKQSIQAEL